MIIIIVIVHIQKNPRIIKHYFKYIEIFNNFYKCKRFFHR